MKIGTKILYATAALAIGAMALSGAARADPTPECNDANAGLDGISGTADDWAGNTECGSYANTFGNNNTATGQASQATSGNNNTATGQGSFAGVGSNNTVVGQSGIAGGHGGRFGFAGNNNTAVGRNSTAMGQANSALGSGAQAGNFLIYDEAGNFVDGGHFGNARNVAIGAFAEAGARAAGQDGNTAVGHNALANAMNATSLGAASRVTADNSVALGAGSVADRANSVSVGIAGAERQIVNVAAGTAVTDAVNVSQLNTVAASAAAAQGTANTALTNANTALSQNTVQSADIAAIQGVNVTQSQQIAALQAGGGQQAAQVAALQSAQSIQAGQIQALQQGQTQLFDLVEFNQREARRGTAAAIALTPAHFPSGPGRTSYTANASFYRGEVAIGLSIAHRINGDTPFAITAGVSQAGGRNTAARVGVAGEF